MNNHLARRIQENLRAGKTITDHIREASADDPGLTRMAEIYAEQTYKMSDLLGRSRPWHMSGPSVTLGKVSIVAGALWLNDKRGPLAAGVFVAGFGVIHGAIREIQNRKNW
jgi:hypothetical protein